MAFIFQIFLLINKINNELLTERIIFTHLLPFSSEKWRVIELDNF